MGGCQIYGPFLGTLNTKCRIITATPIGTISLITTHVCVGISVGMQARKYVGM